MSKWRSKLAIVVVLAVTASTLVSVSPTLAQAGKGRPTAPAPAAKPEPTAPPASEAFVPAPPILTAEDAALLTPPPAPGSSSGLQRPDKAVAAVPPSERTTAMSRHTVDAKGKGKAELFLKPAFRRKAGQWVDVDSRLRRSAKADQPVAAEGALRPVRFGTRSSRIVELGLDQGPVTLSSPGLKLSKPALAGDEVLYRNVAEDTDLRYVVGDDGVKEELVLHSADSPRSFAFHLADPTGQLGALTPDGAGGFAFANPVEEGVALTLPPALAWEQGVEGEPVASDPSSANLEVVAAGDGWDLTVSVTDSWLEGKSFPVVLDPSLSYSVNGGSGPTLEGYAVRNTSSCNTSCRLTRDSYLFAGSWGWANPVRSYVRYDLSAIPTDARIDSSTYNVYANSCMNLSTPDPCANKTWGLDLTAMSGDWSASSTFAQLEAATGGRRGPSPQVTRAQIPGWVRFPFEADMVQRWVNGSSPNHGFAMRSWDERNTAAGIAFASGRWSSNVGYRPHLSVSYTVVAPNTPQVAAYAGNGAARVHWGIPNSGGSPITSYLVNTYRSGAYEASKTVTCPCPTVAAVEGLANGTAYSFKVYARNAVGYSAAATSGVVTPSAALPTAPSPASASPGNGAAAASWRHPATGAADVDYYVIQVYDPDTGYVGEVARACPCATTLGISGLANARPYILVVYAYHEAGFSAPAVTNVVTPSSSRPGAPREASAQASPGAVQVSWLAPTSGPSPSRYSLIPYDSLTGEVSGSSTSITCPCSSLSATVGGLAPGRTYLVAVKANTSAGPGSPTISPAVTLPGVPARPGGLRAMPGDGAAVVAWDASAPNGSLVSGYTLTASPGGATTTVAGDVTAAAFEGLANDTAYTFTAAATNAVGDSAASAPSSQVTPSSDTTLLAPRNVVAVRGDTEAQVSWDEPTVNLNLLGALLPLTQYEVTTHLASGGAAIGTTDAGDVTEVTVTGLKNGTPVYFTVSAQSLLVLNGESSPSNTVTPAGPPFAPTDVAATRGDGQIEVAWLPPGPRPDGTPGDNGDPISGYTATVFRADDNAEVTRAAAPASPTTITGLENGTAYYAKVTATNAVGTGPVSTLSNTVIPAGPPFAPTGVTAVAGNGFAEVSWTAPDDNGSPITGYAVLVSPGGRRVPVGGGGTSTTVGDLVNGQTYSFTVVAANEVGDSEPSAPSSTITPAGPPSVPTNVSAVARDGAAAVRWSPSDGNGASVTYTVTASPGGATRTTMGTSTVVHGLTNGIEYTFRVQATNSVGTSATSSPSNLVTPWSNPAPPPPPPTDPPLDGPCRESTLPLPPSEVYLSSGTVQRQIVVPCIPEFGRVRMGFFIMDYEVRFPIPGSFVVGDGNDRSFKEDMTPDENKVYLEIDYRTGTGFIHSTPSCTDGTKTRCKDALSLRDRFSATSRSDGSVSIDFAIPNSRTEDLLFANNIAISADLDILPVLGGGACVLGSVSRYPSIEAYYDIDGGTQTLFRMEQSDFGTTIGLTAPDKTVPACETTQMPPFGGGGA